MHLFHEICKNFTYIVPAVQASFPDSPPSQGDPLMTTHFRTFCRLSLRHFSTSPTFSSLNLHPSLISALPSLSLTTPTPIQQRAAPPLLTRSSALIAAETGVGKTLAYLLPLVSNLKASDTAPHLLIQPPLNRPRLLILVPTRELAYQTFSVAKSLAHVAKFRVRIAVGGMARGEKRRVREGGVVDVLVTTPGTAGKLRDEGLLFLSRVEAVVLDEADVMMAERTGFMEQVAPVLKTLREGKDRQFVYVAATVSGELRQRLNGMHGRGFTEVRGDRLHKGSMVDHVNTTFVRVSGGEDAKFDKVEEVVEEKIAKGNEGIVLVFCDGQKRREKLAERLTQAVGMEVGLLGGGGEGRVGDWQRFREGVLKIGVCAASYGRGIDHKGIAMVILVDVPMTGEEYLHRVGRVRGKGSAVVLVGERERAVAEAIFLAHVGGEKLVGVNAKRAWKGYVEAGRDRITTRSDVRAAKRRGWARWIDERISRLGTARGEDAGNWSEKGGGKRRVAGVVR